MSRGFDDFDFRDSDSSSLRDFGSGSSSDWNKRADLRRFRDREGQTDTREITGREPIEHPRSSTPSNDRDQRAPRPRVRRRYQGRDKEYSLGDSEVQTLTEVGKFRVVSVEDLAKFGYRRDRSRMESDLRHLAEQGLVQRRGTSVLKKESRQVLTLTKQGERLIRRHRFVPDDQVIYSGLVKPKEADHDSALYCLYQKAAAEIESKGGKALRVQLDYELKEQLYRKLGRAKVLDRNEAFHLKNGYAQQMYLPVVNGKINFPDVRIEYENQDMEIARVDLELATGHYHAGHLAEKARAGFQIYARSEDAPGLRRVRDDREIMTSILSL